MKKRTTRVMPAMRNAFAGAAVAALLASVGPLSAAPLSDNPRLQSWSSVAGAEKVAVHLLQGVDEAKASRSTLADALARLPLSFTEKGVIVEIAVTDASDAVVAKLALPGVSVRHVSTRNLRVTAEVTDPDAFAALAGMAEVRRINPVHPPQRMDVQGLADVAHKADIGRTKYGINGAGQTVGILSDSFGNTIGGETLGSVDIIDIGGTQRLAAGNYIAIATSSNATDVTLFWDTNFSGALFGDCPPTVLFPCNTATSVSGFVGKNSKGTIALPDDPGDFMPPSCGAGESHVAVWCFNVAQPIELRMGAVSTDGVPVGIAIRSTCNDATGDICGEATGVNYLVGSNPQLGGDLPPFVEVILDLNSGGSDEGAAMAELVYDIAPGADIQFYTAFVSESGFADGIDTLVESGSDVIVDDILYFAEPVFQPGVVAQAAARAVAAGVPFYSAAGNFGDDAILAQYNDVQGGDESGVPPQGGDLHRWGSGSGYLPVTFAPNSAATFYLQWNQPFESLPGGVGSQIDMDLYLVKTPNADGIRDALLDATGGNRASNNPQGLTDAPFGDPFEVVSYTNSSNQEQTLYLAVDHVHGAKHSLPQGGAPLTLHVLINKTGDVRVNAGGPTIYGHAAVQGVMAVGAVNWFDTPAFDTSFGPTNAIDPEPFTAKGGELVTYFNAAGGFSPVSTFKPDITAVDGNNTSFFGGQDFDLDGHPNFFGTSAAAPNAAAIVALMRQLNPFLTPAQINRVLEITAIDVTGERAAPGKDDVSGAGLIDALAALDYVAREFGVFDPFKGEAPRSRLFAFDSSAEGWTFEGPSPFTAPTADASTGRLNMRSNGNTNTFGLWKSPEFIAFPFNQDTLTAIDGTSGPTSLFRMTAVVSTDQPSASTVPVARVRTGTSSFEQSDAMVITSTGNSALSPASGARKTYRHYFTLPDTQRRFRGYFDMLNFDTSDAAFARLSLDESIFQAFDTSVLLNGQLERLWLFNQSSSGWSVRHAPPFSSPGSGNNGGLRLGPAGSGSTASFAFWGSPEGQGITLRQGRIYKATFRVASSAGAESINRVPTFRCRVNDSTNQFSAYVNVESIDNASRVPGGGVSQDYTVFFEVPTELIGRQVNFSFDYIFDPGTNNDPGATVTLQSLRVDSFTAPL